MHSKAVPAMKRIMATVCALAMMSGGLFAWQSTAQSSGGAPPASQKKTAGRKKMKPAAKAVAQPLPAQEMPPVPATLMNSAPVKPEVTMEGGLLTIDAPNSPLIDVLNGVHKATGASIEGATPTERVVVKLGPGDPGQVLAALLRGTAYDYVILGAPGRPDALTRVMLTPQSAQSNSAGATGPTQSAQGSGGGRPGGMLSPRQPEGNASNPPEEAATPETEEDQTAQPQTQPASQSPQTPQQPASDANQPKTPEQLFKELQQLSQPKPATPQTPAPQ
jgi:hypothetical protein